MSTYISIHMPIHMSVHMSVHMFVCRRTSFLELRTENEQLSRDLVMAQVLDVQSHTTHILHTPVLHTAHPRLTYRPPPSYILHTPVSYTHHRLTYRTSPSQPDRSSPRRIPSFYKVHSESDFDNKATTSGHKYRSTMIILGTWLLEGHSSSELQRWGHGISSKSTSPLHANEASPTLFLATFGANAEG